MLRRIILSLLLLTTATQSRADEGMWLLDTIHRLPLAKMQAAGLRLSPEQIFSNTNTSLTDAIVLLPGGTGSFVSAEGLILTNHHIAFGGIQELSSVNADYLKNGFHATSRDKELSTSYTAEIVQTITNVTDEVLSVVKEGMSEDEAERAIRAKRKEIEDRVQDSTKLACRVTDMYGGVQYYLFTSLQLKDIRLVYAPPEAIGVFGGETDNWMWPRHTGDFAFLRAYVGPDGKPAPYSPQNVPYVPQKFLPFSTQGVPEGSYAMIMGFPARTFRYREAAAVENAQRLSLPFTSKLFKLRIDIIERWSARDREIGIKYATKLRRLANSQKNYLGTLEGLAKADLVRMKQNEEEQLAAYIASSPDRTKKYGSVIADLNAANKEYAALIKRQAFTQNISGGVELFAVAARFNTYITSLKKDDKGNLREPEEKDRQPVREFLAAQFKNHDTQVDKDVLVAMILTNADLPENERLKVFAEISGKRTGNDLERHVREYVDELYEDSRLSTEKSALELLEQSPRSIRGDEALELYTAYAAEASPVAAASQSVLARLNRLRTKYIEAVLEWKNAPVTYPDANRSIRFTYGTVESLSPRDAVHYAPVTTLTGVMEKESDTNEEFHVPAKLKELWQKREFGRYSDPKLNDVPVAFLTNNDCTGGNSGSPVINGNGELIGCLFDGNWEGVVGDYVFDPRYNRSISVDARYILFVLDKFSGAKNIVNELVIK